MDALSNQPRHHHHHSLAIRPPTHSPPLTLAIAGPGAARTLYAYWCLSTVDKRSPASINGRKAVDSKKPTVDCPTDRPPLYINLKIMFFCRTC